MKSKRKLWRKLGKLQLKLLLQRKWTRDCRYLPLTIAHRELYDIIHCRYRKMFGRFPDLVECQDINDRIQWLKLFDQDREIIRCANKITVRDYIREKVGDQYLVKLYQVHNHFDQIDFTALPNAFVIKTNHDSGTVFLIRNKAQMDKQSLEHRIETALRKPFGWKGGEWSYSYMPPQVLVEELINPQDHTPPPDYKFYCSEGKVKFCLYVYDRWSDLTEQCVDLVGEDLKVQMDPDLNHTTNFKRPEQWDEMIQVAEQLSQQFKFVRVDLFWTKERIYVGELTFWPYAGHCRGNGQKILGPLIDFDRTTYKPFLLPELEAECSRFNLYPLSRAAEKFNRKRENNN